MKMVKNFLIAILLVFSAWCICGCMENPKTTTLNDDAITRIAIFPSSGGRTETYFFEFDSSGKLLIEKGMRHSDDITQIPYMKKVDEHTVTELSTTELNEIISLIKEICDKSNANDYRKVYDCWDIQILYKGKVVQQNRSFSELSEISDLINKLSEISPIEIDLRGFA